MLPNQLILPGGFNSHALLANLKRRRLERERDIVGNMPRKNFGSQHRRPGSEWYRKPRTQYQQKEWWMYSQEGPWSDQSHAMGKLFRRRFRVPHSFVMALCDKINEDDDLEVLRQKPDALGRELVPLLFLVLGQLYVLGRYVHFDDVTQCTGISEETHRKFFHKFNDVFRRVIFPRVVKPPTEGPELEAAMRAYGSAGFPGAFASVDCTHMWWEGASANLKNVTTKGNIGYKTLVFQVTVLHNRKVINVTPAQFGATSDKVVLLYDQLAVKLHRGELYKDSSFVLRGENGESTTYKRLWEVTDNGYPFWNTLIPPFKWNPNPAYARWSKYLESVRKDVEAFFGILKGRFRCIKTGFRCFTKKAAEDAFFTCCALHNMLLTIDGLDANWEDGVASPWVGADGDFDDEDVPVVFQRLQARNLRVDRETDLSGMGRGRFPHARNGDDSDDDGDDVHVVGEDAEGVRMHYHRFRDRLVAHWNYEWGRGRITWPKRNDNVVRKDPRAMFASL